MPRTAPVPNIPAIPGMNPGAWVKGGGGGGGSGNGNGKGGKNGQGASGQGGGDGASGGGPGAGSCGPGSGGGCPSPRHGNGGTAAGDPVDPITGRMYTVPSVDLALPGLIPFILRRSYSTDVLDLDVGLGPGWAHSFAWRIEARRRTLRITVPQSSPLFVERPGVGSHEELPVGRLSEHAWGFTIESGHLTYVFDVREGRQFHLSRIQDGYGNRIDLHFTDGALDELHDSVARRVRVARHRDGRIAAFEVLVPGEGWRSFVRYRYDTRGDLTEVTDALGATQSFVYDDEHRMVQRREAGGLVAEFRYDARGRCVESWCHRAGNDALDLQVTAPAAGGAPSRTFLHVRIGYQDDFTEVRTSRSLRIIDGHPLGKPARSVFAGGVHEYEYDGAGNLRQYRNAVGAEWLLARNAAGQVVREVDPLGGNTEYTFDERGFIDSMTGPLGTTVRYERDACGKVRSFHDDMGAVGAYEYDRRGLLTSASLPNGAVTRMAYDELANRVRVIEPDGATRHIHYDFLGRITSFSDARSGVTSFSYDAMGRVTALRTPQGAVTQMEYDADGNLCRRVDPDGRSTTLRWSGFHVVSEVRRPDGTVVQYRYDREQDLVRVINEGGEEHLIQRDVEGRVAGERTFDGRELEYTHDGEGRLLELRESGRTVAHEYDLLGRLVARTYPDDVKHTFAYDAVGRLLTASTPDVECRFEYDARGNVVREDVIHAGRSTTSQATYDQLGKVVRVTDPSGSMAVVRDVVGRPTQVHYGDVAPLRFAYDADGLRTEHVLPLGGTIRSRADADRRPTEVVVHRASGGPGAGEPQWVGGVHPGESMRRGWAWSPAGCMIADSDPTRGPLRELLRDANGRVLEVREGARQKRFGYGHTGDLYEADTHRVYGPAGRILERGAVRFVYDDHGRVIERVVGDQRWVLSWSDDDRLRSVTTPDGTEAHYTYDVFARRVAKRVLRDGVAIHTTRYAWRGDVLVYEETRDARGRKRERTFVTIPGTFTPIAQQEVVDGRVGAWAHYVHSPQGAPIALCDGAGEVLERMDVGAYGDVDGAPSTPWRLPGLWADEDTGLAFTRLRAYDPSVGCFLRPEPLGLAASLKSYAYADFFAPEVIDADGLARATVFGPPGSDGTIPVLGVGQSGNDADGLHPAVTAALPPRDLQPNRVNDSRGRCAEPAAMSDALRGWEARNPPARCHPPDGSWQRNLRTALGEIDANGGIAATNGSGARNLPACENCGQMVARLHALAGTTPPNGIINAGEAGGFTGPAFQPTPAQLAQPGNAAYSGMPNAQYDNGGAPWPGGPPTLGTWQNNAGVWTRVQ